MTSTLDTHKTQYFPHTVYAYLPASQSHTPTVNIDDYPTQHLLYLSLQWRLTVSPVRFEPNIFRRGHPKSNYYLRNVRRPSCTSPASAQWSFMQFQNLDFH